MSLPMPPPKEYAPPRGGYYHYIVDTKDVPPVQEFEGFVVFTPTFDNLHVYGRSVGSIYQEDVKADEILRRAGRFMGDWFSTACPDGELGSMAFSDVEEITAEQFSAAYEKGWLP